MQIPSPPPRPTESETQSFVFQEALLVPLMHVQFGIALNIHVLLIQPINQMRSK